MNQAISLLALTVQAVGAISAHRAVGFDGAQATVQGQKIMGVSRVTDVDGAALPVDVAGSVTIESGAAISVGDSLIVDSAGRAIPVTGALGVAAGATAVTSAAANGAILTGADLPEFVLGDALEAASAAGEFIEVLLRR